MSLLHLIQKRQSCRNYLSTLVPKEALERCLEAARLAPSACNS
ncbi:MAG: nitroreductase family protein, partial [Candidatus Omnitrophota bacterium]